MKIAVINGSHRGKAGNTQILTNAFLKGAQAGGAETVNITLAEKEIKPCIACKACWFNHPGICVLKDDMAEVLSLISDADIRVLATPLYFDNISSKLKVFVDRLMVTVSPYWGRDEAGECRHFTTGNVPKLIMLANCGFPEASQFQVISHWIKRQARNYNTDIIAEIYVPQGALLSIKEGEVATVVTNYLKTLEQAGWEVAANGCLSEETVKRLAQKFIPDEVYISEVQKYVDSILKR